MSEEAQPRLVQASSFEGLQRALGAALTPALQAAMKDVGVDYGLPLAGPYPLVVWTRVMALACQALYPGRSAAEQQFELGRRILDGYGETLVGKVLLAMARAAGPRRMLERAARNMRTSNTYTTIDVTPVSETSTRMHFPFAPHPDFYRGLLQRGLEVAGGKNARVIEEAREVQQVTFLCQWE